ncbi:MAG: hypothetical protein ACR2GY_00255 [Phycisphaerales bacterium]
MKPYLTVFALVSLFGLAGILFAADLSSEAVAAPQKSCGCTPHQDGAAGSDRDLTLPLAQRDREYIWNAHPAAFLDAALLEIGFTSSRSARLASAVIDQSRVENIVNPQRVSSLRVQARGSSSRAT